MKALIRGLIYLATFSVFVVDARSIKFTGVEGEILSNIKNYVTLSRKLTAGEPLSNGEWLRLRRNVRQEIREACEPFGFYLVKVEREQGREPDDLIYKIRLGEPVRITNLNVQVDGSALQQKQFKDWLAEFPLARADVLNQPLYEGAKKRLLALSRRYGYLDAELVEHEIVIDKSRTQASINLHFMSGERARFGQIRYVWADDDDDRLSVEQTVKNSILKTLISVSTGDKFDADKLAESQRSLAGSPYFSAAELQADYAGRDQQKVPLNVIVTESKRHAFNFVFGAGTDTGLRASTGYENRRINQRGHHLNARLGTSDVKRSVILNYQIPRTSSAQDSINLFAASEEDETQTRTFEKEKIGVEIDKKLGKSLYTLGLTASQEKFELDKEVEETKLLIPSLALERFDADDLYRPSNGWRTSLKVRGASEDLGSDIDLLQVLLNAKGLVSVKRSRIIGRINFARSKIDENTPIPASLGFLAGGDDSVRGYKYESIGVENDGVVSVGKHLLTASVEYEHPLRNGFSAATFIDVGDAFNSKLDLQRGVGVGLRWRLPFGALKLDIASALDLEDKPYRLHFSFGTDL